MELKLETCPACVTAVVENARGKFIGWDWVTGIDAPGQPDLTHWARVLVEQRNLGAWTATTYELACRGEVTRCDPAAPSHG